MRFDRIDAIAFGPLENETLELVPGMNVVYGPNEAGKSSWHAALYAGLCGMRRGAGLRREEREFAERHRPWDGSGWEVGARITLADGRQVELKHDLAAKRSDVQDAAIARRDYANEIMQDGAPDGSRWLGLNRHTFLSTACVRQADILGIRSDPAALQADMQRAAATAGADSTAAAALQRLADYRREQVGSQRAPTRPLRVAEVVRQEARRRLDEANAKHAEYVQRRGEVEQWEQAVQDAQGKVDAMQATLAEAVAATAQERLRHIDSLGELFPEGPPHPSPELDSLAEQVAVALNEWNSRPGLIEPKGPTVWELQEMIDGTEKRLVALRAAVAASAAAAAGSRHAAARDLHALFPDGRAPRASVEEERQAERVRRVLYDVESLHAPPVPVGATVADITAELDAFDASVDASASSGSGIRTPSLVLSGLAVAVGGLLALVLSDLWAVGAGVVAALGVLGGAAALLADRPRGQDQVVLATTRRGIVQRLHSRRDEEQRYEDALARHDDTLARLLDSARQVDSSARDRESATQALRGWLRAREAEIAHREELGEKWDALQGLLRGESIDEVADQAERLAEEAARLASLAHPALLQDAKGEGLTAEQLAERESRANREITGWERAKAERRSADMGYAKARDEVAEAEERLRQAGEAVGIEASDVDELPAALEEWRQRRARDLAEAHERNGQWDELQNLLAGQSRDEVAAEAERLRDAASACASRVGAEALAHARAQQPTPSALQALEGAARAALIERERASGELTEFASGLPSVPGAEEELDNAVRGLERLTRLDATLERTIEFLEAAQDRVHRDIAPVLQRTVLNWLPTVTGGRYVDCLVDPQSLKVELSGADGRRRDASLLSHGTAEQVYLLLRLALARHLTGAEPCPLILDDALAASDAQRKRAILDMLLGISQQESAQVILFTHEEDVRDWARKRLSPPSHRLTELAAPIP